MTHEYASPEVLVLKYGGNAMPSDGADPLLAEAVARHRSGEPLVLVHGGGPEIDRALRERNIPARRIDGLRVTDHATLAVTEAVLSATVNKRLVRACRALGAAAVGISGQDGGLLVARRATGAGGEDLGYVGTIVRVDPSLLWTLLRAGFLPIVSPLGLSEDGLQAYNVNADSAAGAIAAALHAYALVIVTNVARLLRDPDDPSSGIDALSIREAERFVRSAACRGSMKPKLHAASAAVAGGAGAAYLCASGPNAIAGALLGNATVVQDIAPARDTCFGPTATSERDLREIRAHAAGRRRCCFPGKRLRRQ